MWKCAPFPRAFLRGRARGNVRLSHVLFYEAVHVEMYGIPTCLTPMQYSCVLYHVTVHILVSISHVLTAYAAVHVEVHYSPVSFLRCQYNFLLLSHVALLILVNNFNMLIYVAVHVEVRHSHVSSLRWQYNIPMCFPMLQCKF
jgi:hypothetical protein